MPRTTTLTRVGRGIQRWSMQFFYQFNSAHSYRLDQKKQVATGHAFPLVTCIWQSPLGAYGSLTLSACFNCVGKWADCMCDLNKGFCVQISVMRGRLLWIETMTAA